MLLLTRAINLEWEETLLRLFRDSSNSFSYEDPFGPVKQGSFFQSCVNQSGRYCDWNSNGCRHGLFYSQIDPVTRKQFVFQHTPSLIYVYIYLLCMGGLILTISPILIFILLVKHKLVNPIQPHEGFTVSVKCFSLKCFTKIVTFHISSWLVDNWQRNI